MGCQSSKKNAKTSAETAETVNNEVTKLKRDDEDNLPHADGATATTKRPVSSSSSESSYFSSDECSTPQEQMLMRKMNTTEKGDAFNCRRSINFAEFKGEGEGRNQKKTFSPVKQKTMSLDDAQGAADGDRLMSPISDDTLPFDWETENEPLQLPGWLEHKIKEAETKAEDDSEGFSDISSVKANDREKKNSNSPRLNPTMQLIANPSDSSPIPSIPLDPHIRTDGDDAVARPTLGSPRSSEEKESSLLNELPTSSMEVIGANGLPGGETLEMLGKNGSCPTDSTRSTSRNCTEEC